MNNADLIVRILHAAGVRHGFGVPSGNVLPLMEAMRKGGVEFVLTAHEGSAGFAADVSARMMPGVPGLAIATLGPGATNLATGIGNAFLDRSPMIAITCTLNEAQLGRRIQMWIDHHTLMKPITKATFRLERGRSGHNSPKRSESRLPSRRGRFISTCPRTCRWRRRARPCRGYCSRLVSMMRRTRTSPLHAGSSPGPGGPSR